MREGLVFSRYVYGAGHRPFVLLAGGWCAPLDRPPPWHPMMRAVWAHDPKSAQPREGVSLRMRVKALVIAAWWKLGGFDLGR
jgi:hypothetical protein